MKITIITISFEKLLTNEDISYENHGITFTGYYDGIKYFMPYTSIYCIKEEAKS